MRSNHYDTNVYWTARDADGHMTLSPESERWFSTFPAPVIEREKPITPAIDYSDWLSEGNVRGRARKEMFVFGCIAFTLWLSGFIMGARYF